MKLGPLRLISGEVAVALGLLFTTMSFSYGPTSSPPTLNPPIDYIRGLILDTQEFNALGQRVYIFEDQEIQMFTQMQTQVFQSSMRFSGPGGMFIPPVPVAYYRIAGLMLRALAADKGRLAGGIKLLDVTLDLSKSADALRGLADDYEEMDDNAGTFAIIEQVNDSWSFRQRFWNQVARQSGGGY